MKSSMSQLCREIRGAHLAADKKMKHVCSIGVLCNGAILMGMRRDNGLWTTPGGHKDSIETPLQGALRELKEETGIIANNLTALGPELVTTFTGKELVVHPFEIIIPREVTTTLRHDPDMEVQSWDWVPFGLGLPEHVMNHLHSPKNVLLARLGLMSYLPVRADAN